MLENLSSDVLTQPLPTWAGALIFVALCLLLWRQHWTIRRIEKQELRSLHKWADTVDECIDRLDRSKRKQDSFIAANDPHTVPWWKRRTG